MSIDDYINADHDGFYYEPETGRLFKIQEIPVVREDTDDKARSTRRLCLGSFRLCTHIIFFIMTGRWPELIDHKNNDPWDNSWKNIREATKQQNAQNRQRIDPDRQPGVEVTPSGSYRVKCQGIHIGTFYDLEEANECAIRAREEAYGEFAYREQGKSE